MADRQLLLRLIAWEKASWEEVHGIMHQIRFCGPSGALLSPVQSQTPTLGPSSAALGGALGANSNPTGIYLFLLLAAAKGVQTTTGIAPKWNNVIGPTQAQCRALADRLSHVAGQLWSQRHHLKSAHMLLRGLPPSGKVASGVGAASKLKGAGRRLAHALQRLASRGLSGVSHIAAQMSTPAVASLLVVGLFVAAVELQVVAAPPLQLVAVDSSRVSPRLAMLRSSSSNFCLEATPLSFVRCPLTGSSSRLSWTVSGGRAGGSSGAGLQLLGLRGGHRPLQLRAGAKRLFAVPTGASIDAMPIGDAAVTHRLCLDHLCARCIARADRGKVVRRFCFHTHEKVTIQLLSPPRMASPAAAPPAASPPAAVPPTKAPSSAASSAAAAALGGGDTHPDAGGGVGIAVGKCSTSSFRGASNASAFAISIVEAAIRAGSGLTLPVRAAATAAPRSALRRLSRAARRAADAARSGIAKVHAAVDACARGGVRRVTAAAAALPTLPVLAPLFGGERGRAPPPSLSPADSVWNLLLSALLLLVLGGVVAAAGMLLFEHGGSREPPRSAPSKRVGTPSRDSSAKRLHQEATSWLKSISEPSALLGGQEGDGNGEAGGPAETAGREPRVTHRLSFRSLQREAAAWLREASFTPSASAKHKSKLMQTPNPPSSSSSDAEAHSSPDAEGPCAQAAESKPARTDGEHARTPTKRALAKDAAATATPSESAACAKADGARAAGVGAETTAVAAQTAASAQSMQRSAGSGVCDVEKASASQAKQPKALAPLQQGDSVKDACAGATDACAGRAAPAAFDATTQYTLLPPAASAPSTPKSAKPVAAVNAALYGERCSGGVECGGDTNALIEVDADDLATASRARGALSAPLYKRRSSLDCCDDAMLNAEAASFLQDTERVLRRSSLSSESAMSELDGSSSPHALASHVPGQVPGQVATEQRGPRHTKARRAILEPQRPLRQARAADAPGPSAERDGDGVSCGAQLPSGTQRRDAMDDARAFAHGDAQGEGEAALKEALREALRKAEAAEEGGRRAQQRVQALEERVRELNHRRLELENEVRRVWMLDVTKRERLGSAMQSLQDDLASASIELAAAADVSTRANALAAATRSSSASIASAANSAVSSARNSCRSPVPDAPVLDAPAERADAPSAVLPSAPAAQPPSAPLELPPLGEDVSAVEAARLEAQLRAAFSAVDVVDSGSISKESAVRALEIVGVDVAAPRLQQELWSEFEQAQTGRLKWEDFRRLAGSLIDAPLASPARVGGASAARATGDAARQFSEGGAPGTRCCIRSVEPPKPLPHGMPRNSLGVQETRAEEEPTSEAAPSAP